MSASETVTVSRISMLDAADRRGISRQAVWDAIQAGKLNAVQVKGSEDWVRGEWYVYLDEKWEAWRVRPNVLRKAAKGKNRT